MRPESAFDHSKNIIKMKSVIIRLNDTSQQRAGSDSYQREHGGYFRRLTFADKLISRFRKASVFENLICALSGSLPYPYVIGDPCNDLPIACLPVAASLKCMVAETFVTADVTLNRLVVHTGRASVSTGVHIPHLQVAPYRWVVFESSLNDH